MRRKSHADLGCPVASALDVVGDPWTLLVVRDLFWGYRRFEEVRRRLGIPKQTLAERLRLLEEHAVVERRPRADDPSRHEYRLTAKGRDLRDVVIALKGWGDRWGGLDRHPVELRSAAGDPVDPVMVDARTGRTLDELRVRAVLVDGSAPPAAGPP